MPISRNENSFRDFRSEATLYYLRLELRKSTEVLIQTLEDVKKHDMTDVDIIHIEICFSSDDKTLTQGLTEVIRVVLKEHIYNSKINPEKVFTTFIFDPFMTEDVLIPDTDYFLRYKRYTEDMLRGFAPEEQEEPKDRTESPTSDNLRLFIRDILKYEYEDRLCPLKLRVIANYSRIFNSVMMSATGYEYEKMFFEFRSYNGQDVFSKEITHFLLNTGDSFLKDITFDIVTNNIETSQDKDSRQTPTAFHFIVHRLEWFKREFHVSLLWNNVKRAEFIPKPLVIDLIETDDEDEVKLPVVKKKNGLVVKPPEEEAEEEDMWNGKADKTLPKFKPKSGLFLSTKEQSKQHVQEVVLRFTGMASRVSSRPGNPELKKPKKPKKDEDE